MPFSLALPKPIFMDSGVINPSVQGQAETRSDTLRHSKVMEQIAAANAGKRSWEDLFTEAYNRKQKGDSSLMDAINSYRSSGGINMGDLLGGGEGNDLGVPGITPKETPTKQPSGLRVGDTATNPNTGQKIRWNGKTWEQVK